MVAVGLLLYAFFNSRGVITLVHKKQDMHAIEVENQRLKEENEMLRKKLEMLKSDREYVEVLIRDKLEMIKEGEMLIRFMEVEEGEQK